MATITLKGNPIETSGSLPEVGSTAPDFKLVKGDLSEATLSTYGKDRKLLLNIFPSLDTSVCSVSVKKFHEMAGGRKDLVVLNISKDLPFAQTRLCGAEGLDNVETLSAFRSTFARDYGLEIVTGPLTGLCSRAVLLIDEEGNVVYTEQVPEITQEPNYDAALNAVGSQ